MRRVRFRVSEEGWLYVEREMADFQDLVSLKKAQYTRERAQFVEERAIHTREME